MLYFSFQYEILFLGRDYESEIKQFTEFSMSTFIDMLNYSFIYIHSYLYLLHIKCKLYLYLYSTMYL